MVDATVIMRSENQEEISMDTLEAVQAAFVDIVKNYLDPEWEDDDDDDDDFQLWIDAAVDFGAPYRLRFEFRFPEGFDTNEFRHWFNARKNQWKPHFDLGGINDNLHSALIIENIEEPMVQDGGKKKRIPKRVTSKRKTLGGKRRSSHRRKTTGGKRVCSKKRTSGGKRRSSHRRRL
jgi:hypothetical protein